ncbi:polyadenylate-binding protein RBP45-like [Primulina tabacum]|uniref:polyadenylate-binding protein RBP45-like n=1 Tax=Primulina tabacum TaxID=48773 RepID=UPI003F590BD2
MMQPPNTNVPSHMAPPPQYQQYPQQQPSHQWMSQPPQQPQYHIPPPQQPPASGYYYQQPPQQSIYAPVPTPQPLVADDGIRSLWIGDLQYWMDEQYLLSCFGTSGEVLSAKVIRNKQTGQPESYGFIEFVSHASAERSLQVYNGTPMPNAEQTFRLNWASMGAGEKRDDSPEYTIFVGDLASDVTDYMLIETFRPSYPSVKGAKVVTDAITGRPKGYGFVRFADETEQMRAMTEMNGMFCSSRPMRIGPAANKQKMGNQNKASYQTSQGIASEDDPSNTTIFVGNLDSNVTDEQLRQLFGNFGQLLHVKIPAGKRCGFVQFSDRRFAEQAINILNGTQLGGQSIRLSWGRSPSNKQVDPNQWNGGYYGYNTSGYETYGYTQPTQDPNFYYAGYTGYGDYQQPTQQQQQPQ